VDRLIETNKEGSVTMKKLLLIGGLLLAAVGGFVMASAPATAGDAGVHHPDCPGVVTDIAPGVGTPIAGGVYVKAGPEHHYVGIQPAGYIAGPQGGHDVSHVDVCPSKDPTTTLPDPTTTVPVTTQPEVTTTVVETTTTVPDVTTTVPDVTTTVPDVTTTTTTDPTNTTPATTQPPSTSPPTTQPDLPYTGSTETAGMALMAFGLVLAGLGIVLYARRPEELI
jgi:LPXTG-motif cell wall-anchored protein